MRNWIVWRSQQNINSSWWHINRKCNHSLHSNRNVTVFQCENWTKQQRDKATSWFSGRTMYCTRIQYAWMVQNFPVNRTKMSISRLCCRITSISRHDEFHVSTISYHVCCYFFLILPFFSPQFNGRLVFPIFHIRQWRNKVKIYTALRTAS